MKTKWMICPKAKKCEYVGTRQTHCAKHKFRGACLIECSCRLYSLASKSLQAQAELQDVYVEKHGFIWGLSTLPPLPEQQAARLLGGEEMNAKKTAPEHYRSQSRWLKRCKERTVENDGRTGICEIAGLDERR